MMNVAGRTGRLCAAVARGPAASTATGEGRTPLGRCACGPAVWGGCVTQDESTVGGDGCERLG